MAPSNDAVEALSDQIATEVHAALYILAPLVGDDLREIALDGPRLRLVARRLAHQLLDDRQHYDELGVNADEIAEETAVDVMCGLWPHGSPPPEWWHTPLGRAVARSHGFEDSEAVSATVAAKMLGVGRSRVYALLDEGKLDRHPDGGVARASVMQRLASAR